MALAPPPSLSLRQLDRGGGVQDPPVANPATALLGSRALVLLIHGYNNNVGDARQAYEGFRAIQREIAGLPPDARATTVPLVDVYWPGDADWGIVSFLYYPWAIERAKQSAPVLARALDEAVRLNGFKEIEIVAHSIGCRLAFELLRELRAVPGVLVRRVVFMAAAVPTFMLDPGEVHALRDAFDAVVAEGAISLYSSHDVVLALAFPLGQTTDPGEGFLPTALGHQYWASAAGPRRLEQHEVVGAGHSDYWGWREATREDAREAARWIRPFLGLGDVPAREVCARPRVARGGVETREGVPERTVAARTVTAWQAA